MSDGCEGLAAVVLAGDRVGGNALARAHDLPAGVLVPALSKPLIERVLDALRASRSVSGGVIVGPERTVAEGSEALRRLLATGDFRWVAPARGPSASALAGADALDRYPLLVTAGDHALLQGPIVDRFCADAARVDADVVVGLVPHASVRAAFPESRRTVLRFADAAYCGSNLFYLASRRGRAALELWRSVEQARKRPWRIALRLGPTVILRHLAGTLRAGDAFSALSRRAGCAIGYCVVDEARAAVDVDSDEDLALAERLLADV